MYEHFRNLLKRSSEFKFKFLATNLPVMAFCQVFNQIPEKLTNASVKRKMLLRTFKGNESAIIFHAKRRTEGRINLTTLYYSQQWVFRA